MAIMFLAAGDPDSSDSVHDIVVRLAAAMSPEMKLDEVRLSNTKTLVLNVLVVSPRRGIIPNGTSLKRLSREFWSAYSVDFDDYMAGDFIQRVEALRDGFISAVRQVPDTRMPQELKLLFNGAIAKASERTVAGVAA